MDEPGKFWARIWSIVGVVVISLAALASLMARNNNANVLAAIQAGADPIQAACAFNTIKVTRELLCYSGGKK